MVLGRAPRDDQPLGDRGVRRAPRRPGRAPPPRGRSARAGWRRAAGGPRGAAQPCARSSARARAAAASAPSRSKIRTASVSPSATRRAGQGQCLLERAAGRRPQLGRLRPAARRARRRTAAPATRRRRRRRAGSQVATAPAVPRAVGGRRRCGQASAATAAAPCRGRRAIQAASQRAEVVGPTRCTSRMPVGELRGPGQVASAPRGSPARACDAGQHQDRLDGVDRPTGRRAASTDSARSPGRGRLAAVEKEVGQRQPSR